MQGITSSTGSGIALPAPLHRTHAVWGGKNRAGPILILLPPPLQGVTNGTGLAVYTAEALLEDTRHRLEADPDAVLLLLSLQGITDGTGLMVHTEALDVERITRIKAGPDAVRMLSLQGITNGTGLAVYTAEALLRNFLLTANSLFAPAGADAAAYRTTATFVMFVRIFPQLPVLSPDMFSKASLC